MARLIRWSKVFLRPASKVCGLQVKWLCLSTTTLVSRGNQAQQQNFRSSSKSPDLSFFLLSLVPLPPPAPETSSPLHSFHPNGTLRWAFVLARSGCVYQLPLLSAVTKRSAKGWNDSVTHASRTSLSFCAVGWRGGSEKGCGQSAPG